MESKNTQTIPKNFTEKIFSERTGLILTFIALFIMLLGIYVFAKYGSWDKTNILDESKMGEFGDFIGGIVGTLVALVGIILYYVALTEQRKVIKINQDTLNLQISALNNQIIEFKEQREELISTRRIYEQQTKTMKNQQFDSNFYSLLDVYISIKNNLNKLDYNSLDYFQTLYDELESSVVKENSDTFFSSNRKAIEQYTNIYLKNRGNLSSYFKTIYRLIKFIDECDHLKEDEKIFYSKIVRSQISDSELLMLYYNYHSIYGVKAQPLILKYRILKHIQRLSKIEFIKHFNFIDENNKNRIVLFVERLIDLINNNFAKANDIESTNPIIVQEEYSDYKVIIGIDIDVSFELRIICREENLSDLPFIESDFSEFINLVLNDFYYFEKFERTDLNTINKSIIKENGNVTFKYTRENL